MSIKNVNNESSFFCKAFCQLNEIFEIFNEPPNVFDRDNYVLKLCSNQFKVYALRENSHLNKYSNYKDLAFKFFSEIHTDVPNYVFLGKSTDDNCQALLMRILSSIGVKARCIFDCLNDKTFKCNLYFNELLIVTYTHYSKYFCELTVYKHAFNILKCIVPYIIIEINSEFLLPNFHLFQELIEINEASDPRNLYKRNRNITVKYIPPENKGFQLLSKLGWKGGSIGKGLNIPDSNKDCASIPNYTSKLDEILKNQGVSRLDGASRHKNSPPFYQQMSLPQFKNYLFKLLETYKLGVLGVTEEIFSQNGKKKHSYKTKKIKDEIFFTQSDCVREFSTRCKNMIENSTLNNNNLKDSSFISTQDLNDINNGNLVEYYFDTLVFGLDLSKQQREAIHKTTKTLKMKAQSFGSQSQRFITIFPFPHIKYFISHVIKNVLFSTFTATTPSTTIQINRPQLQEQRAAEISDRPFFDTVNVVGKLNNELTKRASKKSRRKERQKLEKLMLNDNNNFDTIPSSSSAGTINSSILLTPSQLILENYEAENLLDLIISNLMLPDISATFNVKLYADFINKAFESPWDCIFPKAFTLVFENTNLLVLKNNNVHTFWYERHSNLRVFFQDYFLISGSNVLEPFFWHPFHILTQNKKKTTRLIQQIMTTASETTPNASCFKRAEIICNDNCIWFFELNVDEEQENGGDEFLIKVAGLQLMTILAHNLPFLILEKPFDMNVKNNIVNLLGQVSLNHFIQIIQPFGIPVENISHQSFMECVYERLPLNTFNYCLNLILSAYLNYVTNSHSSGFGCEILILGNKLSSNLQLMIFAATLQNGFNSIISAGISYNTWFCIFPYINYGHLINDILPSIMPHAF